MVAVEASLVLNEIATGERMTPGQNEAEVRVSSLDRAGDAIDLVAATVDVPGLVEHVGTRSLRVSNSDPASKGARFRKDSRCCRLSYWIARNPEINCRTD